MHLRRQLKILSKAESVLDNYSKSTGINVQKSLTQPTSYDKETDTIILNNKKPVNPGSELRTAVENSNAIYFAISQSVANNKRLDISNQFSMPEKDIEFCLSSLLLQCLQVYFHSNKLTLPFSLTK